MKICPTCNQLYHREVLLCPKDGSPLDFLREWQPGDLVSRRFRIIEKIGQGSMGPLFKAEVLGSSQRRALKALGAQLCDDQFIVEQFRRKFQVASTLRHPNVIQMDSLELSDDGRLFIMMEYASGVSLRVLVEESGRLPVAQVVDIAAQMCSALECAHRLRLVHRDIRPENVFLTVADDGRAVVKVAEFGMASLREVAAKRGRKIGGVTIVDGIPVAGTLEYMSPEQARGTPEDVLDGRSDLYSLAVVMFEALTGFVPIRAETPLSLLLRQLEMSGAEALYPIVTRALQSDREDRYSSASEMASALGEIAAFPSYEAPQREMQPGTGAQAQPALLLSETSRRLLAAPPGAETPAMAPELPAERPPDGTRDEGAMDAGPGRAEEEGPPTDEVLDELRRSWRQSELPSPGQRTKKSLFRLALAPALLVTVAFAAGVWLVSRRSEVPSPPPGASDYPSAVSPQEAPAPSPLVAPQADETTSSPPTPGPADAQQGGTTPGPESPTSEVPPTPRTPPREGPSALRGEAGARTSVVGSERRAPVRTKVSASRPRLSAVQQAELNDKLVIGRFLMERKDYRAAITVLEEALEIDPSSLEASAALQTARSAAKNPDTNVNSSVRTAPGGSEMKR